MTDFSLLQTPDYVGGAINALKVGQQARQGRDRRSALASYGTDPQGATNALMAAGDVETAGQLQGLEANKELVGQRRAAEGRAQAGETREADAARLKQAATLNGFMINGVKAVSQIPLAQRDAYFNSTVAPQLQSMSVPDEVIKRFGAAPKDDAALNSFATLLGKEAKDIRYQFINLGNGGVARGREDTGDVETVIAPRPELKSVGAGETLVEVPNGASSPLAPIASVESSVLGAFPGAQVTSAARTPQHNAEVGGVPNSYHLTDQARDIVPPRGMTTAQLAAQVRGKLPGYEVIDEGSHIHIEPTSRSAPKARVVAQGAPKPSYRPATSSDLANYPSLDPKGTYQVGPDGQIHPVGPSGDMTPRQAAQTAIQLRSQFNGEADVKAYNDVAASYEQVNRLFSKANPSPGDDLAGTYAFMKMQDPGSVVREGEFAMVGRSAGLPDRVVMALSRLDKGQGLTPELRKRLIEAANTVYDSRAGRYDQLVGQYTGYAKDLGMAEAIQPRVRPSGAGGQSPPPQALAQLKPGHNTTFANGQVWTMANGQPKQVK